MCINTFFDQFTCENACETKLKVYMNAHANCHVHWQSGFEETTKADVSSACIAGYGITVHQEFSLYFLV